MPRVVPYRDGTSVSLPPDRATTNAQDGRPTTIPTSPASLATESSRTSHGRRIMPPTSQPPANPSPSPSPLPQPTQSAPHPPIAPASKAQKRKAEDEADSPAPKKAAPHGAATAGTPGILSFANVVEAANAGNWRPMFSLAAFGVHNMVVAGLQAAQKAVTQAQAATDEAMTQAQAEQDNKKMQADTFLWLARQFWC